MTARTKSTKAAPRPPGQDDSKHDPSKFGVKLLEESSSGRGRGRGRRRRQVIEITLDGDGTSGSGVGGGGGGGAKNGANNKTGFTGVCISQRLKETSTQIQNMHNYNRYAKNTIIEVARDKLAMAERVLAGLYELAKAIQGRQQALHKVAVAEKGMSTVQGNTGTKKKRDLVMKSVKNDMYVFLKMFPQYAHMFNDNDNESSSSSSEHVSESDGSNDGDDGAGDEDQDQDIGDDDIMDSEDVNSGNNDDDEDDEDDDDNDNIDIDDDDEDDDDDDDDGNEEEDKEPPTKRKKPETKPKPKPKSKARPSSGGTSGSGGSGGSGGGSGTASSSRLLSSIMKRIESAQRNTLKDLESVKKLIKSFQRNYKKIDTTLREHDKRHRDLQVRVQSYQQHLIVEALKLVSCNPNFNVETPMITNPAQLDFVEKPLLGAAPNTSSSGTEKATKGKRTTKNAKKSATTKKRKR